MRDSRRQQFRPITGPQVVRGMALRAHPRRLPAPMLRAPARPTLRADVIAASVVAAHNNALRTWLRSAGQEGPSAQMDHALRFVQNSWGPEGEARSADEEDTDDVVLIAERKAPMWRVVRGIESTLGEQSLRPAPLRAEMRLNPLTRKTELTGRSCSRPHGRSPVHRLTVTPRGAR
ncbi:hypothetical protein ACFW95_46030, partial [Streptomyces sp. NPDC059474]